MRLWPLTHCCGLIELVKVKAALGNVLLVMFTGKVLPVRAGGGASGGSSNLSVCTRASAVILVPAKIPEGKEICPRGCEGSQWSKWPCLHFSLWDFFLEKPTILASCIIMVKYNVHCFQYSVITEQSCFVMQISHNMLQSDAMRL